MLRWPEGSRQKAMHAACACSDSFGRRSSWRNSGACALVSANSFPFSFVIIRLSLAICAYVMRLTRLGQGAYQASGRNPP